MPTRTRTPSRSSARTGRAATPNRFPVRRSASKQSGVQKMLGAAASALPGLLSSSKSKSRTRSGGGRRRAGGMALLAGGLGLAMKNRSKINGLMGKKDHTTTPPTTGAV